MSVTRTLSAFRRAEAEVESATKSMDRAKRALYDSVERRNAARLAFDKARMISGRCPICEAPPNVPCLDTEGRWTHTARVTTAVRDTG